MILADVPQFFTDAGTYAAAFVAVLAAIGAASRLRPVRWVWTRLITMPFGAWLAAQHTEALAPLSAKVDRVDVRTEEVGLALVTHMADEMVAQRADLAERKVRTEILDRQLGSIEARLDDGAARFDQVDDAIGRLTVDVGRTMAALGAGNPEFRP